MNPAAARLEPLWRALLEQTPGCRWLLDANLDFQTVLGDSSPIFGKSAQELPGTNLIAALAEEAREPWAERIRRALAGETVFGWDVGREGVWSTTHFPVRFSSEVALAGGFADRRACAPGSEDRASLEAERARVSHLLHDEIGPALTAVGLRLDLLRLDLPEAGPRISATQEALENAMRRTREASRGLEPAIDAGNLPRALEAMVARRRQAGTTKFRVLADGSARTGPPASLALARVASEALDAATHGGAAQVHISLAGNAGRAVLEIRDDAAHHLVPSSWPSLEHAARRAGLLLYVTSGASGGVVRAAYSNETAYAIRHRPD